MNWFENRILLRPHIEASAWKSIHLLMGNFGGITESCTCYEKDERILRPNTTRHCCRVCVLLYWRHLSRNHSFCIHILFINLCRCVFCRRCRRSGNRTGAGGRPPSAPHKNTTMCMGIITCTLCCSIRRSWCALSCSANIGVRACHVLVNVREHSVCVCIYVVLYIVRLCMVFFSRNVRSEIELRSNAGPTEGTT